jgi:hypothetical protein
VLPEHCTAILRAEVKAVVISPSYYALLIGSLQFVALLIAEVQDALTGTYLGITCKVLVN